MAVVEPDHHRAVGPVHRQEREDDVVDDERRDLRAVLTRHGAGISLVEPVAPPRGRGGHRARDSSSLPDARAHLAPYLLLFLAGAAISLLGRAGSYPHRRPGFLLSSPGPFSGRPLLLRAPDLSDDVFRYLWDGAWPPPEFLRMRAAPRDPAVSSLSAGARAEGRAPATSSTVYPPVAQAAFRVFGGGGRPDRSGRRFAAAADLSVVALLWSAGGQAAGFAAALYARFIRFRSPRPRGRAPRLSRGRAAASPSLAHLARELGALSRASRSRCRC